MIHTTRLTMICAHQPIDMCGVVPFANQVVRITVQCNTKLDESLERNKKKTLFKSPKHLVISQRRLALLNNIFYFFLFSTKSHAATELFSSFSLDESSPSVTLT